MRRLLVPKLPAATHFRAYKITKRIDEDISAVLAAFCLTVEGGQISDARVAFGGMAGIPKRAKRVEENLRGLSLADTHRWHLAAEAVGKDFTPLTDLRASAAYRSRVAGNLVIKAHRRICGRQQPASRVSPITGRLLMPPSDAVLEAPLRHVYKPLPHDSGAKHVQGARRVYRRHCRTGRARLHIAVGGSPVARGTIRRIDLDEVPSIARRRRGHHGGATFPGKTTFRPATARRAGLCTRPHRSSIASRSSRSSPRRATPRGARSLRGKIEIDAEKPNVPVEQGRAAGEVVLPDYAFVNGDVGKAIAAAPLRSAGTSISAARSIFIWKARSRSPFPAKTARCWSIPRPSIRAKCSTSSPAFSACRICS